MLSELIKIFTVQTKNNQLSMVKNINETIFVYENSNLEFFIF